MKITKHQLKQIIREELECVLKEAAETYQQPVFSGVPKGWVRREDPEGRGRECYEDSDFKMRCGPTKEDLDLRQAGDWEDTEWEWSDVPNSIDFFNVGGGSGGSYQPRIRQYADRDEWEYDVRGDTPLEPWIEPTIDKEEEMRRLAGVGKKKKP